MRRLTGTSGYDLGCGLARSVSVILAALLGVITFDSSVPAEPTRAQIDEIGSMPLAFTQNVGQWDDRVSFRASADRASLWFTNAGLTYQFLRPIASAVQKDASTGGGTGIGPERKVTKDFEQLILKAILEGANPCPEIIGERQEAYKCNYFIGNDSTRWHADVPNFESILYHAVYPGVDLRYHGNGAQIEYDFVVAPGGNPAEVRIRFEGTDSLSVDSDGSLVLHTQWGRVLQQPPIAYQERDGRKELLSAKFVKRSPNIMSFEVTSTYDAKRPLIIDPVLVFSTFLGGANFDEVQALAVNGNGEAIIAGYTASSDFPTVSGFQASFGGGSEDGFVTEFNALGSAPIFSTFIGGTGSDYIFGLTLSSQGILLCGQTNSTDFPMSSAVDNTYNGGTSDAFVVGLGDLGDALVFSTYLGGSGSDAAEGVASACISPCITPRIRIWVCGSTQSSDFPTAHAYSTTNHGQDAFITGYTLIPIPFSLTLSYSTYFGGTNSDGARAITLGGSTKPYIAGFTGSSDFPVASAYKSTLSGSNDAFVASFGLDGGGNLYPLFSTYFGGIETAPYSDGATAIMLHGAGNVCFAGYAASSGLATPGSFQPSFGGKSDAFVAELSPTGTTLNFCTYLGGSNEDQSNLPSCLTQDGVGNIYLGGSTNSVNFPTVNPLEPNYHGTGGGDVFIAKLNSTGTSLLYGTYLGGVSDDFGGAIALDTAGSIYVAGGTSSTDFPLVNPPYDGSPGGYDAFLTKISGPFSCCIGTTGNVNASGIVDLSDLSALVSYLTGGNYVLPCPAEANVNNSGIVDLSDLSSLVSYLTGGSFVLPSCP